MVTRPRCPSCGCFLRGDLNWIGSPLPHGSVGESANTPRCHVCPLLGMTSQRVMYETTPGAFNGSLEWHREQWRGREDEANAWEERFVATFDEVEAVGVGHLFAEWTSTFADNTSTGPTGIHVDARHPQGQALIERILAARRPRSTIEGGPRSRYAAEDVLRYTRLWLAGDQEPGVHATETDRHSILADARTGHTSREVPSFSIHDRYRESAPDGIGMEPRTEYLEGEDLGDAAVEPIAAE